MFKLHCKHVCFFVFNFKNVLSASLNKTFPSASLNKTFPSLPHHFAGVFGNKKNVIESFRFHPTLILLYLKACQFYNKF